MRLQAVIFDLWDTLIAWDKEASDELSERVNAVVGDGFAARWRSSPNRYTAPIRTALADAGVPPEAIEDVCTLRAEYVRRSLVPVAGAVETLEELRRRGYRLGLITVCSEDVERLWSESEFAGLFDAEVFSSRLGVS